MNSRQAAAFGVPLRIDQLSQPQTFWFHTIATGAPFAMADCARDTHVLIMSTSPEPSICSTCEPVVHHTSTCFEILSRLAIPRSRLHGYTCEGGRPSAISASSKVSKGYLRNPRRPGKSLTFHISAHELGAFLP